MRYKVTACWYETVEVEADDDYEAIVIACKELKSEIRQNGHVDDFEIVELDCDDSE